MDAAVNALAAAGHKVRPLLELHARCHQSYGIWHDVCARCQSALREMGIEPPRIDAPQPEAAQ